MRFTAYFTIGFLSFIHSDAVKTPEDTRAHSSSDAAQTGGEDTLTASEEKETVNARLINI